MPMDMAARAMAKQAEEKAVKQASAKATTDKRIFPLPNVTDGSLSLDGVKGKTLHNLYDKNKTSHQGGSVRTLTNVGNGHRVLVTEAGSAVLLYGGPFYKEKTPYSISFTLLTNIPQLTIGTKIGGNYTSLQTIEVTEVAKQIVVEINSELNFEGMFIGILKTVQPGSYFEVTDLVIVEKKNTSTIPPYFEGIKSVGEDTGKLVVKSTGKNLSPVNNVNLNLITGTNGAYGSSPGSVIVRNVPIEIGEMYKVLFESDTFREFKLFAHNTPIVEGVNNHNATYIAIVERKDGEEKNSNTPYVNTKYKYITLSTGNAGTNKPEKTIPSNSTVPTTITNLQIIKGNVDSSFEPYKESKLEIPLIEPLRSLSNGVADEIKDGKIIRRVGKKIINGSENWESLDVYPNDSYSRFGFSLSPMHKQTTANVSALNNKMFIRTGAHGNYEYLWLQNTSALVYLQLLSTTVAEGHVDGLKNWLSRNNIELYYELENPKETPLTLPSAKSFTNGMVTIDNNIWPSELTVSYSTNVVARVITTESTLSGVLASTLTLADKELAMKTIATLPTGATLTDAANKVNQILSIWR